LQPLYVDISIIISRHDWCFIRLLIVMLACLNFLPVATGCRVFTSTLLRTRISSVR